MYDSHVSDISEIEDDQPTTKRYSKRSISSKKDCTLHEIKRKKSEVVVSIGSDFKCDKENNQILEKTCISAEDFKEREDRLKVTSEIEVHNERYDRECIQKMS